MNQDIVKRIRKNMKENEKNGIYEQRFDMSDILIAIDVVKQLEYEYGIQLTEDNDKYIPRIVIREY